MRADWPSESLSGNKKATVATRVFTYFEKRFQSLAQEADRVLNGGGGG